ncbi:MAG: Lipoprotein-releasing system transmembrane protein LolE [Gammaproteobacteria bacterium]|nr:Lipoprotein-releasing system transmembrane protein LolE [Gammaproteobacteria bacterium]
MLPVFIGLRYTRAKRRNHFISFITLIAMLGIALGVWALITVLSIMNGFEQELRDRILGVASHVTITGTSGSLAGWGRLGERVARMPDVTGVAPYVHGQGMLSKGKNVSGAIIRGVLPAVESAVSDVGKNMEKGRVGTLESGEYRIIVGSALARSLDLDIGSKVIVVAPKGQITPAGMLPRLRRFTVSGIFKIGMYEYDSGLALIHLNDARKLYQTGQRVTGLRLKLDEVFDAPLVRNALANSLEPGFYISDWTRKHRNFFRALKIEKRVMFIILFLIVAVAAFNIVSTLVMVVTDKRSDIAILRTLGLRPLGVMGIFIVQGMIIGVIGTLLGGLTGVITALNIETLVPFLERLFDVQFFPADVYVISDFPADMHWQDVFVVMLASLSMSAVATLYPAFRASRTHPAEALRYE